MRSVFVLCACLLTACSTQSLRCARHLTPINRLQRPSARMSAPHQVEDAAAISGAMDSQGKQPMSGGRVPAQPKHPRPAVGGEGMP